MTNRTNHRRQFRERSVVTVTCVSFLLTACGDQTLMRLTEKLAAQGRDCSVAVERCYKNLNDANHKLDEDELKLHGVPELNGVNLPPTSNFTAKYDEEVVQPRVRMATLISAYCSELDTIVNARKPEEADQTVNKLNGVVGKIGGELLNIPAIASKIPTQAISVLTEPIKTLSSFGLQAAFVIVRENWAKDTLNKRAASFEDVCVNMVRDLNNSIKAAQDRARNVVHLRKIVLDRKIKKGLSEDEKNRLIQDISAEGQFADSLAANNPAPTFSALRDQMHDLADWAKAKSKPASGWNPLRGRGSKP